MMEKKRAWGAPLRIDGRWKPNGRLARHRPYFFYHDDELFPCDDRGFRIPAGHASIEDKFATNQEASVFCYGGSTTFGVYCAYEQSYPHVLETLVSRPCFNLGLQSLDIYGSLLSFVDHLRNGLVPATAVFLDGTNENQGYIQAVKEPIEEYLPEFRQYRGFRNIILNASLRHRIREYFFGTDDTFDPQDVGGAELNFVEDQAEEYLKSVSLIQRIAQAFDVQTVFLLQPTIWDVWPEGSDPRHNYLKKLYKCILDRGDGAVREISADAGLDAEWFVDWAHLNSEGNAALARRIAAEIQSDDT